MILSNNHLSFVSGKTKTSVIFSLCAALESISISSFFFMIQLFQEFQESENISLKINVLSTQMANIENQEYK